MAAGRLPPIASQEHHACMISMHDIDTEGRRMVGSAHCYRGHEGKEQKLGPGEEHQLGPINSKVVCCRLHGRVLGVRVVRPALGLTCE